MVCEKNVAGMQREVNFINSSGPQRKAKKLEGRFQWVFMNNKLERLQQELSRHKAILHASLSLCGRQNDNSLRNQADIAQQIIHSLHDSTTEQYQTLDGRIQEAASQASQSTLKALNAIQSLESTNILGASASSISGAIDKNPITSPRQPP